ncbi:hypothetical protein EOD39_6312 [Acipenser ruthenus]|uniref:Uncharacterized protein n=1 Tax=Acipenser ruthenus TaxID=7906 RepID=A0A444UAK4_ACIRT|nr:hypothetical protein EOD39_6312 [Acipenser ruthenus]
MCQYRSAWNLSNPEDYSWLDSKSEGVGPQRVAPSAGPPTRSTASVSPSAWNLSNPEDYSWLDSKSEGVGPQRVAPSAGPPTRSTASVSPSAWNLSNPEDYSWLDSKSEGVGPQRVAPSAGPPTRSTASVSPSAWNLSNPEDYSWLDSKSEGVGPQRVAPSAGPPTRSTASVSPSAWNLSNPEDYSWLDSKSEGVGPQRVAPSAGPPTRSTASVSPIKTAGLELFYKWIMDEVTEEAAKVFEILKIETLITGKTFGAEITFLDKLSQNLRSMGIDLQKQACEYNSDKVLLLFCPVISRIGTDIDAVIQNISPYKKVILVVMHHSRKKVLSESSRLVNKSNVLETVDCLYYETDGFYHCDANTKAITSVSSALLRYQKTT